MLSPYYFTDDIPDYVCQVHAGFDGPEIIQQERSSVQQSTMPSQSKPAAQHTANTGTSEFSDLEDIMASMSQFDVSHCFSDLF